jgi:hypothetical protein
MCFGLGSSLAKYFIDYSPKTVDSTQKTPKSRIGSVILTSAIVKRRI